MVTTSSSRVGRNATASSGAAALAMLLSLITTPVLLHSLGLTGYGALAVIGSLTAYIGIFDFGVGGSLSRYMTLYSERGDARALAGVTTFVCVFYAVLAALASPLLYLGAPVIARLLSFQQALAADLPSLLLTLLGIFVAANLSGVLSSRLISIHRLDVSAYIAMAASVASAALTIIMVPIYPSLYTVFACNLVQILINAAGMSAAIAKLTCGPPVCFGRISWREIHEILSFSIWTQISSITAIVNLEADKIIISRYLGLADVASYQVANRIAMLSRVFPLQLVSAMLPELTARSSHGLSASELESLYGRSLRSLMVATMFISGFIGGAADGILRFWVGARLPWAAELCVALVLSFVVNNATGVGTTVLRAQGKPQLETTYGIVSAVINIGMTSFLVDGLGLFGVLAGTIVGNVIGSSYFLVVFHSATSLSWWRTTGRWLVRLTAMMVGAGSVAFTLLQTVGYYYIGKVQLILCLIPAGLLYVIVFLLLGFILRFWDDDELLYARRLLAMMRPAQRARK